MDPILILLIYFIPTFIAIYRQHHNANAILFTNLFFGWTGVGWCRRADLGLHEPPAYARGQLMKGKPFRTLRSHDLYVVNKIVERAQTFFPDRDERDIRMDLLAAHLSCPLRLDDLLNAADVDFVHDIVGIERHLDRQLFYLRDSFVPRYAKP